MPKWQRKTSNWHYIFDPPTLFVWKNYTCHYSITSKTSFQTHSPIDNALLNLRFSNFWGFLSNFFSFPYWDYLFTCFFCKTLSYVGHIYFLTYWWIEVCVITFNDRLQCDSKLKPYSLPCSLETGVIFLLLCNNNVR